MSFRFGLTAAAGAMLAAASPASAAFSIDFAAQSGSVNPLTIASGDNTLSFDSPAGPGVFSVGPTGGLFTGFAYGLGDYGSFSGDTLTITLSKPVSNLYLSFGIEDAFGASGSDFLTLKTNTGVTEILNGAPNGTTLSNPEGSGVISGAGFTSVTITSANPFAVSNLSDVPEPTSLAVVGAGLLGLLGLRRRA